MHTCTQAHVRKSNAHACQGAPRVTARIEIVPDSSLPPRAARATRASDELAALLTPRTAPVPPWRHFAAAHGSGLVGSDLVSSGLVGSGLVVA